MLNKLRNFSATILLSSFFTVSAFAEQVGEIDVDWIGNDIIIDAIVDPKVQGVTCHIAYFERGLIDRLQKGNWFEDPSNSSISCRQTGPIKIGDIELDEEGEQVFKERRSIILKSLRVKRVFDAKTRHLSTWPILNGYKTVQQKHQFPLSPYIQARWIHLGLQIRMLLQV